MADNQNKVHNECNCVSNKKLKSLEKQIATLQSDILQLRKDIEILRRASRR